MQSLIIAVLTVACAYFLDWSATELIWGFWLMSLVRGFVLIATYPVFVIAKLRASRELTKLERDDAIIGLVMMAFATFHYGAFHVGYAIPLQKLFPIIPYVLHGRSWIQMPVYAAVVTTMWPLAVPALVEGFEHARASARTSFPPIFGIYGSIIRIHVLIFVLAVMTWVHAPSIAMYFVIIVAFLPYGDWVRARQGSAK